MDDKPELLHSPYVGPHIPGLYSYDDKGKKMSACLKDKLRNRSRSFSSPLTKSTKEVMTSLPAKKPCLDAGECSSSQIVESPLLSPKLDKQISDDIPLDSATFSQEDIETCSDYDLLKQMHLKLEKQISDNEEKLRKLKLVHNYRMKNKPDELVQLIAKWLTASHDALLALYDKLPEKNCSFSEFLTMLNVDKNIIRYDPEREAFY